MSLSSDYKRQYGWRDWPRVLAALPPLQGQTVLDVGCGVGDLAAEFVARGARVIGVDMNKELLREARSKRLPNADFHNADLKAPLGFDAVADGLWCSFTAAYFPDLTDVLRSWRASLRPGGWAASSAITCSGPDSLSRRFLWSTTKSSHSPGRPLLKWSTPGETGLTA